MQSSDERSKGAGRPSLLTPAQQAEADRNRILTKLEHGKTQPRPAVVRAPRRLAWGVLALALIGGAAAWMMDEPAPAVVAVAGTAPVPAAVPAPVPAATIHDEPRAAGAPPTEVAAKPARDDLRLVLEEGPAPKTPAPAPAKAGADDLRDALEATPAAKKTVAPKPAVKAVKAAPKPPAKPVAKAVAKDAPRKVPARATPDGDLALLSALVAHTQSSRASDNARALKRELKACRRLKGNQARDCREEVCLGQDRGVAACR